MAANKNGKPQTSTQIRNIYSEGVSYLNISFYNLNLSFRFTRFLRKENGKSIYDTDNPINTTVNYESAYALYETVKKIIDGEKEAFGVRQQINCAQGVFLILERKVGNDGQMETTFSVTKENITIPFKFQTSMKQVVENGQLINKVIESGLGVFMKTIEGYLTGINSDRHLDKYTDDYIKSANQDNNQNNGGYNKYNNNRYGGNKKYNNQRNNNNNNWQQKNQQNISSYDIAN